MSRLPTLLLLLALAALACNAPRLGGVDERREQLDMAATRAAEASSAAATAAVQAATVAAAAAAQSATALATLQAIDPTTLELPLDPAAIGAFLEQLESLNLGEDGQFTVTLTEAQINAAIGARQAAEETPPRLQNVFVTLDDGLLTVTGDVTSPVQGLLVVAFRPLVVDGRLQFEAISATFGEITVPVSLLEAAVALLNNTIGQSLALLPANVTVRSVAVADGVLTLVVGRE